MSLLEMFLKLSHARSPTLWSGENESVAICTYAVLLRVKFSTMPMRVQVLELMQMHPKERLRRVILIASRYSTDLKLENYYFFTFTFSWPEVGKLFHIYFFLLFLFLDLKLENYSIFTFLLFLKLKLGNYSVVTFLLFLDQKLENYSIFRWLSARLQ